MEVSEQIKILAVKLKISVAEIARRTGQSPQNFNQKMKRESFTVKELQHIAEALDCDFEACFILRDSKEKV